MGYHLTGTNFNNALFEDLENHKQYASQIPDVVLVKKVYARKKKSKARNWRLKRMTKEESEMRPRKQDQDRQEQDYEIFLRDVEEDEDMRQMMSVYKAQQKKQQQQQREEMEVDGETEGGSEDDEGIGIPMEQLLEEFDEMGIEDDE